MTQEEIDALPDEFELTLRKPIELNGKVFTVLTFNEPTVGQLEEAGRRDDLEAVKVLLALSAGVAPAVINKMVARDLKKATAFIESFSQDAQRTGGSD